MLFCHGGARAQFAALPLNLLGDKATADYIDGGYWAHSAIKEAEKYCAPNVIDVKTRIDGLSGIKPMKEWQLSADAAYVHYCPNETIDGVAIDETPDFGDKVVIGDYSSTILSRPLDVSRFGVIYAGAQKNIGPAGLTLVIVRDDLLGKARKEVPSILDYTVLAENDSMFNTPPTFAWYLSGLVFKWLKEQGGLVEMQNAIRPRPNCCTRPSINPTLPQPGGDRQPFLDERAVPAGRCGAGQGVPQRGRSHRPAGAERAPGSWRHARFYLQCHAAGRRAGADRLHGRLRTSSRLIPSARPARAAQAVVLLIKAAPALSRSRFVYQNWRVLFTWWIP